MLEVAVHELSILTVPVHYLFLEEDFLCATECLKNSQNLNVVQLGHSDGTPLSRVQILPTILFQLWLKESKNDVSHLNLPVILPFIAVM